VKPHDRLHFYTQGKETTIDIAGMIVRLKTLEGLTWAALFLAGILASASDNLGNNTALWFIAGSGGLYALARGLAKLNRDDKNFWETSEFYVLLISVVAVIVVDAGTAIDNDTRNKILGWLGTAAMIARGLAKRPEVQAHLDTADNRTGPIITPPDVPTR
jgi:hypothetical protein